METSVPGHTAEKLLSVDEFLAGYPCDGRSWELHDGRPIAMAPTSNRHRAIVRNLYDALKARLPSPCYPDFEAAIKPLRNDREYWEADIATSCSPTLEGSEIASPVVIVEVLSKTTAAHDREVKLPDYQRMPSVIEILLIHQDKVLVEVYRRSNPEDDIWQRVDLDRLDEVVVLRGHGIEMSLRDIYPAK
jgi:Uma2 family endonuclease